MISAIAASVTPRTVRYGKHERVYQGAIDVASSSIWLRAPSHVPRDTPLYLANRPR